MNGIRAVARRTSWGLADQALSSITNFLLALVVARSLSAGELGAFGVTFAAYTIILGLSRSFTSEPLVMRFSSVPAWMWRHATLSATGTAVLAGCVAGLCCVIAGQILPGSLGNALTALGVFMPGLLVQDCWRFAFFASGRGHLAFWNDLVWGCGLAVAIGSLVWTAHVTLISVLLSWGAAATLAAGIGCVQTQGLPRLNRSIRWWNEQRDVAIRFFSEFGAMIGAYQFAIFGIGALAGLRALGTVRAGQIILGPLNVIFMGLGLISIPEAVRLLQRSQKKMLSGCILLSTVLAAAALVWGVIAINLPLPLGRAVLGDAWARGRIVVLPLAIAMAGSGIVVGAASGLRALGDAGRSLRSRLIGAAMTLIGGLGGAVINGGTGAAWGLATSLWFSSIVWWGYLIVSSRSSTERHIPNERSPEVSIAGDQLGPLSNP